MPQPPNDLVLNGFAIGTMVVSIATGLYLLTARRARLVLRYEPRRPVPWGPAGTIPTVIALAITAYTFGHGRDSTGPLEPFTFIAFMLQQLFVAGGYLFVVAV